MAPCCDGTSPGAPCCDSTKPLRFPLWRARLTPPGVSIDLDGDPLCTVPAMRFTSRTASAAFFLKRELGVLAGVPLPVGRAAWEFSSEPRSASATRLCDGAAPEAPAWVGIVAGHDTYRYRFFKIRRVATRQKVFGRSKKNQEKPPPGGGGCPVCYVPSSKKSGNIKTHENLRSSVPPLI